ncbi:MAG: histidinol phosphate phosphatase [Gammaproteobacteria bacterium]|nr:histidinol phosphate phosphatase [Gammaproteobacteria bacterium]
MKNLTAAALKPYLDTAISAADSARQVTRKWFRLKMKVGRKEDRTPVTIADQETETVVKNIILDRHPRHGFFGEESGQQFTDSEWRWVIDPIDGTKCFATGMPTFGTLISLLHEEEPVIGIIDHAMLNDRWIGLKDAKTTHNRTICRTRNTMKIADASVYTTTLDMFDEQTGKQFENLTRNCKFRVFGGDCYSYGLLASGYNDLVCEADLHPYDYFALVPVILGAGGVITDWQGRNLGMKSNGQVLAAANSTLHGKALEKLN